MKSQADVLLLDDGELDDVRALLEEMGASLIHLRGGAIPEAVEAPRRMVVTTARRAALVDRWSGAGRDSDLQKICVVSEDSNTLRNMLRRMGFDLLLRRPVHPYAIRLVLLRGLYQGRERRGDRRVAIGYDISVRSGLRRRDATLAELSARGCRLLSRQSFPIGARLTLQIPRELTGDRPLTLRARVVRCGAEGTEAADRIAVAMAFEGLNPDTRSRIARILKERIEGPARLSLPAAAGVAQPKSSRRESSQPSSPEKLPLAAPSSDVDRRKNQRATYTQQVMTLGEEADLTLMGRDLSSGGMRVDAGSGLKLGDALRLAIYGAAREEPFLVRARVVRDDGPDGLGLRFEDLTPAVADRLERLVARLPAVEPLQRDEAESVGNVVSRILERFQPE